MTNTFHCRKNSMNRPTGWAKNCASTVSQQTALQRVPIKRLVRFDCDTHSIAQAHSILDYY